MYIVQHIDFFCNSWEDYCHADRRYKIGFVFRALCYPPVLARVNTAKNKQIGNITTLYALLEKYPEVSTVIIIIHHKHYQMIYSYIRYILHIFLEIRYSLQLIHKYCIYDKLFITMVFIICRLFITMVFLADASFYLAWKATTIQVYSEYSQLHEVINTKHCWW